KKKINANEYEVKRYLNWVKLRTTKFLVPGANVPISINHAWASLHIIEDSREEVSESLEKEIAKYHEWERLSTRREVKKNAQEIMELGKRIVLIGGPGSGKSTLAKRTVNRIASKGEKVVYIRLPNVAKEMEQGKSFDDALWSNALDGYQGDKTLLKSKMKDIDILIADGLDECEPFRKRINQSLHDWLIGRENTRIVVTTRPVGYEPAQFNTFIHVEILPLEKKEIEKYSLKLLENLNDDEKKVLGLHKKFQQQLETNKMVNVASRSPLLLNFLIQLLVSGKTLGNYRAGLYSKILEEWIKQSDRGKEKKLDEQIALRSIEYIGWILQNALEGNGGRSEQYVLQKLSFFIESELNYKPLQAKQLANICLQFWVEVGILEHIKVGYEGGYTFIHLTLGEYATARYIYSLQKEEQRKVFLEKIHVPVWRETLLLASGIGCTSLFVELILNKVSGETDIYNDISFASAMLVEAPPDQELNKKVTERAMDSLASSYSSLCYETGDALEGIAQQEPDWLFELVNPLLLHEQNWTKLVAYKLALITNRLDVDLITMKILISMKPGEHTLLKNLKISSGRKTWNKVLELSMKHALNNDNLNDDELRDILEMLKKVGFNANFHISLSKMLVDKGKKDLLSIFDSKLNDSLNKFDFFEGTSKALEGERALFNAVLQQISIKPKKILDKDASLIETSKLCQALGYNEKPIYDLNPLVDSTDNSIIDEVIKGVLLVYELDQEKLYHEINWLLNDSQKQELLFLKLPDVLISEPNWEKANGLLQRDLLIQALSHPSQTIASNGTLLLCNCFEIIDIEKSFTKAFMETKGEKLFYFGAAAPYILEERALNIILEHLENKLAIGSNYLYQSLAEFPQAKNSLRVNNILMKGIKFNDSVIAKSAAIAMLKIGGNYDKKEVFEVALHWNKEGVWCNRDKIQVVGGSCPKCRIVPDSPLPELVRLLKTSEDFSLESRICFSNHQRMDVEKAGLETLTYYLANHTKEISRLIQEIKIKNASFKLLNAIFDIDSSILRTFSKELFSLYESKEVKVREKILEELAEAKWANIEGTTPIVVKALKDESVPVRNQALITYRSLRLSEKV
ncbi:NACHT domain-containing protein, partial [Priestia megaterium]|uniref:NACHT domain-containing protein n=1 Tax=Priestia megaterium TaxID=1404 RepID=UPI0023DC03B5